MKILFDTSALVAAIVDTHSQHLRAFSRLQQAQRGSDAGFIATHGLAELYSILTSLPIRPPILPVRAKRLIEINVLAHFRVVPLATEDYSAVIADLAERSISGGAIYDALILRAAMNAKVDQIVTLNRRHFMQIAPALAERIVEP